MKLHYGKPAFLVTVVETHEKQEFPTEREAREWAEKVRHAFAEPRKEIVCHAVKKAFFTL